jgi:hypothetical protein
MLEMKELDWKILRRVHPLALERFCKRVLAEIDRISGEGAKSYHALPPNLRDDPTRRSGDRASVRQSATLSCTNGAGPDSLAGVA